MRRESFHKKVSLEFQVVRNRHVRLDIQATGDLVLSFWETINEDFMPF